MVERHLAKVDVAGSSPVFRSNMRVSYIGNTPAFQAGKVGSIPTTRSIMVNVVQLVERQFVALVVVGSSPIVHPICRDIAKR